MEHGLRTGFALGTVDPAEAVRAADILRATTLNNAQLRRQYMDVRADLQKRFGDLLSRADQYVSEITESYRSSIIALRPGAKCAHPDADAIAVKPVTPEFPRQASGNTSLDRAALEAARASQYTPKIVNCQPVAGTFVFRTTFSTGP